MTIPAWVNNGTRNTTASATTLAPAALPGSRVNNNILFSWITIKAGGKSPTITEAGWSVPVVDNTGNQSGAWSWRIIDGTEAGPTWNWVGAAAAVVQVSQFSTPNPGAPIGVNNSADANASTTLTVASIPTTADNSLILIIGLYSSTQGIAVPDGYIQRDVFSNSNSSYQMMTGQAIIAGNTDAISATIGAAENWVSFGIELLGSGVGVNNDRTSQVVQSMIEDYADPIDPRTSQVVQSTIENYSDPTIMFTTQIAMSFLRTTSTVNQITTEAASATDTWDYFAGTLVRLIEDTGNVTDEWRLVLSPSGGGEGGLIRDPWDCDEWGRWQPGAGYRQGGNRVRN